MPCYGGDDGPGQIFVVDKEASRKLSKVEAMLCAILTVATKVDSFQDLINVVDWREAGVTRKELLSWWATHQKEDEARRKREEAEAKRGLLKGQALSKLTPTEKRALGL